MCLLSTTQLTQILKTHKTITMKKPSVVFFLITLMLAAVVCIQGSEQVKDTNGNPVKTGEQYFIQPVKTESNNGGGLAPAALRLLPSFCPLGIVQSVIPTEPGLPVSFALPLGAEEDITTSSVVNIKFQSTIPFCSEFSKLWKVDDSSSASKEPPIIIGGTSLDPNSQFKIEEAGAGANTYKLTSFTGEGTVGAIQGGWAGIAPLVVLTNDNTKTLLVEFKKVEDATTAATSTSRVEKLGLRMFPFY